MTSTDNLIKAHRKCIVEGCDKLGQHTGNYRTDGTVIRRAKCHTHHMMELPGYEYKRHRKSYCEDPNCKAIIDYPEAQLHVHHKDCNHSNNKPSNLITLCANCHAKAHAIINEKKQAKRKNEHLAELAKREKAQAKRRAAWLKSDYGKSWAAACARVGSPTIFPADL